MAELALYRKYRPATFAEVIGQDHVVKVLEGAIKNKNITHAYLFSGSRGTGKTSIARIFARAVGCATNDLYEIDAASNRGIDEIRALREAVRTLPFESPYKVYIIDEAHMLTKDAFNALLKTLEEPPDHVIFILATTEVAKVPETIISRCQTFQCRKPVAAELAEFLRSVAQQEKFSLDQPAIELIVIMSDGSFRDAVGALQKAMSLSADQKITFEELQPIFGAPSLVMVADFLAALLTRERSRAWSVIESLEKTNYNPLVFVKFLLLEARALLVEQLAPAVAKNLGLKAEVKVLRPNDFATLPPHTVEVLKELLEVARQLPPSPSPLLLLELLVVKFTP